MGPLLNRSALKGLRCASGVDNNRGGLQVERFTVETLFKYSLHLGNPHCLPWEDMWISQDVPVKTHS